AARRAEGRGAEAGCQTCGSAQTRRRTVAHASAAQADPAAVRGRGRRLQRAPGRVSRAYALRPCLALRRALRQPLNARCRRRVRQRRFRIATGGPATCRAFCRRPAVRPAYLEEAERRAISCLDTSPDDTRAWMQEDDSRVPWARMHLRTPGPS